MAVRESGPPVVILLLATASSARAADREPPTPLEERRIEIGVRAGVSAPVGGIAASVPMKAVLGWLVPITIDVGLHTSPRLFVGGYLGGGFGRAAASTCDGSCWGYVARIGGQVRVHGAPNAAIDPWLAYGIGYEMI